MPIKQDRRKNINTDTFPDSAVAVVLYKNPYLSESEGPAVSPILK
jgi:hypothetical protein